ncbi:MAG: hypothetical protein ACKOC5_17480 [Chloroflexota bacterium]
MAEIFTIEGLSGSRGLRLLLASPIIWSIYHVAGSALLEALCRPGTLSGERGPWLSGEWLGLNGQALLGGLLALAALLGVAAAGLGSLRLARSLDDAQLASADRRAHPTRPWWIDPAGLPGDDRERLLGLAGVLFSAILLLIISADGASALVLRPCQ